MTLPIPDVAGRRFSQLMNASDAVVREAQAGEVRLEPDAAANAARACAALAHEMRAVTYNVEFLKLDSGLDAFESSRNLKDRRLNPKADGPSDSLKSVLDKHVQELEKLKDLYIAAGKAYQDSDFEGKQQFAHIDFDNLTFRKRSERGDGFEEKPVG